MKKTIIIITVIIILIIAGIYLRAYLHDYLYEKVISKKYMIYKDGSDGGSVGWFIDEENLPGWWKLFE